MTHPAVASFAQFADIGGYKRSYVTELRKKGRLVLTEDGKAVKVPESLQLIRETSDPSKAGVAARHAANRAKAGEPAGQGTLAPPSASQAPTEADDEPLPTANDGHSTRRAKALADKEEALARAAIRADRLADGELLDIKDVDDTIANAGTQLRKSLERIPDDLAPLLAPITDESKVRSVLADAIESTLREFARQFGAMAKAGKE